MAAWNRSPIKSGKAPEGGMAWRQKTLPTRPQRGGVNRPEFTGEILFQRLGDLIKGAWVSKEGLLRFAWG
jgi:hypothetical protein